MNRREFMGAAALAAMGPLTPGQASADSDADRHSVGCTCLECTGRAKEMRRKVHPVCTDPACIEHGDGTRGCQL